jgi:hypothetical protein
LSRVKFVDLVRERFNVEMGRSEEGSEEAQGDRQPSRALDLLHHLVADELHKVGQ